MPCLGGRKKKKTSVHQANLTEKGQYDPAVAQMKQEYRELKSKNEEHLDVIARQSAELADLRQKLDSDHSTNAESILAEMEARNKETLSSLQQKELLLQQKEKEIQELMMIKSKESVESILAEKEELLQSKEEQINALQLKWQAERAELVKPALEEVSAQLEQLKKTNEDVKKRLADKEGELAELRSELTRRERTPTNRQVNDVQERQKRLNRLTVDLENDRLMIQKLEELNQQLEAQKQQHEAVLQTHAEAIAEKDRELIEQQQSLSEIKTAHLQAIRTLERNQQTSMAELKTKHEKDLEQLKQRLGHAEKRAKSDMNDEVERLLREFEQSEHDHTQQMAHLQKSHREQLSSMKQDQQAEIRSHIQRRNSIVLVSSNTQQCDPPLPNTLNTTPTPLRKTGGPAGKVLRWPTMGAFNDQPELMPKDPHAIHVYISSVSANSTVKRNQESIQSLLSSSQIQYQIIDVARREPALQHMRKQTNGRTIQLPLIFVGGHYRGQLEDLIQAQDSQTLTEFLSLSERSNNNDINDNNNTDSNNNNNNSNNNSNNGNDSNQSQGDRSSNSSVHSSPVTTPTSSRVPSSSMKQSSDERDDEFLLRELEKELSATHSLDFGFMN